MKRLTIAAVGAAVVSGGLVLVSASTTSTARTGAGRRLLRDARAVVDVGSYADAFDIDLDALLASS